jgi:hypothetical protein
MTLDEATAVLRHRLAHREENFLETLRRTVFEQPPGVWRQLFQQAGCHYADLERMVRTDGVEGTLRALRRGGVGLTFEEFKGRAPITRGGREIPAGTHAFDNPLQSGAFSVSTGGSTGRGRTVDIDVEHLWDSVPSRLLNDSIHGFLGVPMALWFDGLPGNGPNGLLGRVAYNAVPERWFSPLEVAGSRPALRFRLAQSAILATARASGVRLPPPEAVSLEDADHVARWAGEAIRRAGGCGIRTMVSRALRIALAAEELGIDLTGAVISGGGEPPTPAKVAAVRRTGARWVSNYSMQEIGPVGHGCAAAIDENDLHLQRHHVALITHPRQVPGFDVQVDAFQLTTLLPSSRKLMINVELDDYGIVEERRCGCPWDALGFHTHIRGVRSFRKLTGEGMTLIGTDMVRILEDVLPSRFGGSPLDYQLLEEEDERGFTRLSILVHPRLTLHNEGEVVDAVLSSLGAGGADAATSGRIWAQAKTLRVKRSPPIWTNRGKLMPLHFTKRAP